MTKAAAPYLLGIDIGTTNLKAILFDHTGQLIATSSRPTRSYHPDENHPDWTVYSPLTLWEDTIANIQTITSKIPDPENIMSLAIASMGEPIIPVDRKGNWLYPAICWFDQRTEPQARWWRQQLGARRIYDITGQPVSFFMSLNSMLWIRQHEPKIFQQTYKWLVVADYITYKLTGTFVTDYSIASRTMGFDVVNKCWSEEIFSTADLDPEIMPKAYPSGTAVGEIQPNVATCTGLKTGTIVATGGHDHGCAALPATVNHPNSILNSTGTTDVILGILDNPLLTTESYQESIPIYPHPIAGKYQAMDCILFGANALDWYINQFGSRLKIDAENSNQNVYELLLESAAKAPPRCKGLLWLPNARGTPTNVATRGAFLGIRESHTSSEFIRAIIEGICYETRLRVDRYERLFGKTVKRMVVVGGTSNSTFFTQLRADVTGREVEIVKTSEATCLGAAMLAGIAAGTFSDYDSAVSNIQLNRQTFTPNESHFQSYDEYYQHIYLRTASDLQNIDDETANIFPPEE